MDIDVLNGNWLARLGITRVVFRTWHVEMMVVPRRPRSHWLKVSSPFSFPTLPSFEELTRTMTSNLPVRLGSCVLSVLGGKGPHAGLDTQLGCAVSSSILPVLILNYQYVIQIHGICRILVCVCTYRVAGWPWASCLLGNSDRASFGAPFRSQWALGRLGGPISKRERAPRTGPFFLVWALFLESKKHGILKIRKTN